MCTVKIVYTPDYPDANELFCTGTATVLLNSAKNNMEFQQPSTRSEAIGLAFKNLGNVFGRNLSRKLDKNNSVPDDFNFRTKIAEKLSKAEVKK